MPIDAEKVIKEADEKAAEEWFDRDEIETYLSPGGWDADELAVDAFLAGIAHERERVRSGKADGWMAMYDGNITTHFWEYESDVPSHEELTWNDSPEEKAKWRIVPVKLIEVKEEKPE